MAANCDPSQAQEGEIRQGRESGGLGFVGASNRYNCLYKSQILEGAELIYSSFWRWIRDIGGFLSIL